MSPWLFWVMEFSYVPPPEKPSDSVYFLKNDPPFFKVSDGAAGGTKRFIPLMVPTQIFPFLSSKTFLAILLLNPCSVVYQVKYFPSTLFTPMLVQNQRLLFLSSIMPMTIG